MIKLTPSLLAADLMHLGRDIDMMRRHGLDQLHFDVMDAHFVPNLSFGPDFLRAIGRQHPDMKTDVHLMMDNPDQYLHEFAKCGASSITVHAEIGGDLCGMIRTIQGLNVKAGLSVKPETPVDALLPYLKQLDLILIMTVEPGFGGQKFMPEEVEKIRFLRKSGFHGDIAVDGGVSIENAALLRDAGTTLLVMGTSYFRAEDPSAVARYVEELNR
ncbi:MAG: ribulose-phosphate 3-epimerase [Clostridia bacterium]|nr:ribulose-phosphate 3-epimerase [Clostridia bacterium]